MQIIIATLLHGKWKLWLFCFYTRKVWLLLHVISFVACEFDCVSVHACNIPVLKHSRKQVRKCFCTGFVFTFLLWFSRVASDLVLN